MHKFFRDRLRTPHATADETFQNYTSLVSTHSESEYEGLLVEASKAKGDGQSKYSKRERWENQLVRLFAPVHSRASPHGQQANAQLTRLRAPVPLPLQTGDAQSRLAVYPAYVAWELKPKAPDNVRVQAVYARAIADAALVGDVATLETFWLSYLTYLVRHPAVLTPAVRKM